VPGVVRDLFEYSFWANAVISRVAQKETNCITARTLLAAMESASTVLTGQTCPAAGDEPAAALWARLSTLQSELHPLISRLRMPQLEDDVRLPGPEGTETTLSLTDALLHLVLRGEAARAQCLGALASAGLEAPAVTFAAWLSQGRPSPQW
jgi:hypothetical protein